MHVTGLCGSIKAQMTTGNYWSVLYEEPCNDTYSINYASIILVLEVADWHVTPASSE